MAKPAARIALLQAVLGLGALVVGGRAMQLQLVQHERWSARAAVRDQGTREVPARRGTIYDRHGVPLAITQERYRVGIARNEVRDEAAVRELLVEHVGIPREEVARRFRRDYAYFHGPFSAEEVEPLRRVRGVHLEVLYGRSYPQRAGARDPLLGHIDLERNRGLDALERMLDTLLRGTPGVERVIRAPGGTEIAIPRGTLQPAIPGRDVYLTIDQEWQTIAEGTIRRAVAARDAEGGDAVIYDIASGELLAVASVRRDARGRVVPTASAFTEPYEPGSTAKILTVGAMLRAGSDTTPVHGENGIWRMVSGRTERTYRDVARRDELLSPGQAIKWSSNIAMAKFALKLPADSHYQTLRDFGVGTYPGLGFPSETRGLLLPPARSANLLLTQPSWAQGYELEMTPIQIAAAYGSIANDGVLMQPAILREVRDPVRGTVEWAHEPHALRRPVSPAVAAQLMAYLAMATDSGGGGARARLARTPVIGKTGTAVLRNASGSYGGAGHRASFAAIFPGDDPQVVLYLMINKPQGGEIYGGEIAAPLAREILEQALATPRSALDRRRWLERVTLPTVRAAAPGETPPVMVPFPLADGRGEGTAMRPVPAVAGHTVREALHRLHQAGFTVRLAGRGLVRGTEPAAGDSLPLGATLTLLAGPE